MSAFADFGVTSHVVERVWYVEPIHLMVSTATSEVEFEENSRQGEELFWERPRGGTNPGTLLRDSQDKVNGGDAIGVALGSPSQPEVAVDTWTDWGSTEQRFLDVDVYE